MAHALHQDPASRSHAIHDTYPSSFSVIITSIAFASGTTASGTTFTGLFTTYSVLSRRTHHLGFQPTPETPRLTCGYDSISDLVGRSFAAAAVMKPKALTQAHDAGGIINVELE
ncbi:hypothetical protein DFJ73DRAFT_780659 [Zopfochytrium polystomum]|nr:hypothetical protein DFJ73DRAFT_780659 [Zopfochytrium polystomum]